MSSVQIPKIIYGTHRMDEQSIMYGLSYGAIDTATGYQNDEMIAKCLEVSGQTTFIVTKFSPKDFETDIEKVADDHIKRLGRMPNIFLIHSTLHSNEANLDAFRKLRNMFPKSLIGVSNFDLTQTQYLVNNGCTIDVIQLEYHPHFQPKKLVEFCQQNKISVMAYRPFAKGSILKDPEIIALAKKCETESYVMILKWLTQKGIIPVISSTSLVNIKNNLTFDHNGISLENNIVCALDAMDKGVAGSTCMMRFCRMEGIEPVV